MYFFYNLTDGSRESFSMIVIQRWIQDFWKGGVISINVWGFALIADLISFFLNIP